MLASASQAALYTRSVSDPSPSAAAGEPHERSAEAGAPSRGFPWWLPILVAAVAATAAFALTDRVGATYRAEIFVLAPSDGLEPEAYVALVTEEAVLQETLRVLRLDATTADLRRAVDVSNSQTLIKIGVLATDRAGAQLLAQTLANTIICQSCEAIGDTPPPALTDPSRVTTERSGNHTARNAGIAAIGGLLGGLVIAFGLAGTERAPFRPIDLLAGAGWRVRSLHSGRPEPPQHPAFGPARAHDRADYLELAAAISDAAGSKRTLCVVGLTEAAGASEIAANLALARAEVGLSTALVDADLRTPRQHLLLGIVNENGLGEALRAPLAAAMPPLRLVGALWVLPSGSLPAEPIQLLASQRARSIDALLADAADLTIYDTTPLDRAGDALAVAGRVGATLMVVNRAQLNRAVLRSSADQLRVAGALVIGAVLIEAEDEDFDVFEEQYGAEDRRQEQPDRAAADHDLADAPAPPPSLWPAPVQSDTGWGPPTESSGGGEESGKEPPPSPPPA